MLFTVLKVMEKMILERLRYVAETNNLLSITQLGFREGKSTQDSATILEGHLRESLNTGKTSIVIYVDLASAFDRVWHIATLWKLVGMGFRGRIIGWLLSYLSDRKFKVFVEGKITEAHNIASGVLQGAVISPFFFNVLLNDLTKTQGVNYLEYADDLVMFCSAENQESVVQRLQQAMKSLIQWCKSWGQKISFDKTKAQYFTNRREYPSVIRVYQFEIPYVVHHKYLGLHFDSPRLTWKEHIAQLRRKCSQHISIMKSVSGTSWGADRKILLQYYTATIRSKMDYCCHVYDGAAASVLNDLTILQNQCLRIALGVRNTTPIITLLVEANVPPLDVRRKYLSVKYYNKMLDSPRNSSLVNALYSYGVRDRMFINYFQRMLNISNNWFKHEVLHKDVPICSRVAPWVDINRYVTTEFSELRDINDGAHMHIFNELVANEYLGYLPANIYRQI